MTRSKEFFNFLEEKDIQLHIKIGYDGRYSSKGIGTLSHLRGVRLPYAAGYCNVCAWFEEKK